MGHETFFSTERAFFCEIGVKAPLLKISLLICFVAPLEIYSNSILIFLP